MDKHLRNAPLVEALFELRWGAEREEVGTSHDPAYPIVVGLLYEQVKQDYPFIETLPQSRLPAEMLLSLPTHRFRFNEAQWPLVQIGPGIATLNYTTSYTWEAFQTAAVRFLAQFRDAYQHAASAPPQLRQVTLRYINALEFQFEEQDVLEFLRDKLHVVCVLPEAMAKPPTSGPTASIRLQVSYPLDKPRGTGVLNIGRGEKKGKSALVWDLLLISQGANIPGFDILDPWLSDAHDVLEKWFFTLIEGDLYQEFRGET